MLITVVGLVVHLKLFVISLEILMLPLALRLVYFL